MLKFFRSLVGGTEAENSVVRTETPSELYAPGVAPFAFASSLQVVEGLPVPDWEAVSKWVNSIPDAAAQAAAWNACEVAWMQHLRAALGPAYHLASERDVLLVSSLEPGVARATIDFIVRTQSRIIRLLDGIAKVQPWGYDILVVFDDEDPYYRYVVRYYGEGGEFARSGGMHINAGCSHFVTMKADLRAIEPVIAHEMTHGCLGHLPIPAWLNEGLAVNTEQRLCPPQQPLYTPVQMHEKHRRFWGVEEIQQFWSGASFHRPDNGQMLSYDLARILVEQFSMDWESFRLFVTNADLSDSGAAAAREHLGLELGEVVATLFEKDYTQAMNPDPDKWEEPPEKGGFVVPLSPAELR